jgi:hypothetical protein
VVDCGNAPSGVSKLLRYTVVWTGTLSAGAHTYKVTASTTGANSLTYGASATAPSWIGVEDLGPAA